MNLMDMAADDAIQKAVKEQDEMSKPIPLLPGVEYLTGKEHQCNYYLVVGIGWKKCAFSAHYKYEINSGSTAVVCGRHYRATRGNALDNLPTDMPGYPAWVPMGQEKFWVRLSETPLPEEMREYLRFRYSAKQGQLSAGELKHLLDGNLAGDDVTLYKDRPTMNVVENMAEGGDPWVYVYKPYVNGNNITRVSSVYTETIYNTYRYVVPVGCAVCGNAGALTHEALTVEGHTVVLGHFHRSCFELFTGAPEKSGWWYDKWCRHFVRAATNVEEQPTVLAFTCEFCENEINVAPASATAVPRCSCALKADTIEPKKVSDKTYCLSCGTAIMFQQKFKQSYPNVFTPNRVNIDVSLHVLLADLYVSAEIGARAPTFEKEANDIQTAVAATLLNYAIAACGGELRYVFDGSGDGKPVKYGSMAIITKPREGELNKETMFCVACFVDAKHCSMRSLAESAPADEPLQSFHQHNAKRHVNAYWKEIDRVLGSNNGPVLSFDEVNDNPNAVLIGRSFTTHRTTYDAWDGTNHPVFEWFRDNVVLSGEPRYRLNRFCAWERWWDAIEYLGPSLMEYCYMLFYASYNNGGVAGYKWGRGAEAAYKFMVGEFSALQFADIIWGIQHNGGPFLNKCYHLNSTTSNPHNSIKHLLNIKRDSGSADALLFQASKGVLDLWIEAAKASNDPAMIPGVIAIEKCRTEPTATRQKAFQAVLEEVRSNNDGKE